MTEEQNHRLGVALVLVYTLLTFLWVLSQNTLEVDGILRGFDIENTLYEFWKWFMLTWIIVTIYVLGNVETEQKPNTQTDALTMLDAIMFFLAIVLVIIWLAIGFGGVLRLIDLL